MARTIETIFNRMIEVKESKPELSSLNSTSKTAIWRLMFYVIAVIIWSIESLMDRLRAEIVQIIDNSRPGTIPWYHSQVLAYQFGDELIWDDVNYKFIYETITQAKQIIKRCAIIEGENMLTVKVSKHDDNGLPIALSSSEKTAFESYLNKIKFAGIRVNVISLDADVVAGALTVYYNPLMMRSDGTLISDDSYPVKDAINAYLAAISYGGFINKTRLVDAVQSASGVIDITLDLLTVTPQGESTQTVTGQNFYAISGAFRSGVITVQYVVSTES